MLTIKDKILNKDRHVLFEELIVRYTDIMYYVACSWCENENEAEDLVQEAFLRAYNKFDSFSIGTNFKAWIFRILRNLFIDNRRYEKKSNTVNLENFKETLIANSETIESIDIESQEIFYDLFSDEIIQILQKLPKSYQICIILCDVEGLKYREIANIMDCSVGTIRSRIHRGRVIFQKYIGSYAKNIGYLKESVE